MRTSSVLIAATVVSLLALYSAQADSPDSRLDEEMNHVRNTIRELQADPLAKDAQPKAAFVVKWGIDNKRFAVRFCPSLLGPVLHEDKKRRPELYVAHMLFGSTAFMIDNPERRADTFSMYEAGVVAALDVYKLVVARDHTLTIPFMDDLLKKRDDGALRDYLVDEVVKCK